MKKKNVFGAQTIFACAALLLFVLCIGCATSDLNAILGAVAQASQVSQYNPVMELPVGSTIPGRLAQNQEIWYSVRANQSGFLIVETTSEIDTFLVAHDTQRNVLAENDDGGSGLNARIELMTQPNIEYLFRLTGYGGSAEGPYMISASIRPLTTPTALRLGTGNRGYIETNQDYWFRVSANQNGILRINTTGSTDTHLEAYNESYELLSVNDDGGEDLNAQIDLFVRSGENYIIRLRAYGDNSGAYELLANIRPYPTPTQLAPGAFLDRTLAQGEEHWFSVRTTRAGQLTVYTTGSTDTMLAALTSDYQFIVEVDDYEDLNARVQIPVQAGTTIFRLKAYGSNSGPYRINASFE